MLLSAPGDYGFTFDALLARRPEPALPADFAEFWQLFREETAATRPAPRGTQTVEFRSIRDVRVTMRIDRPDGPLSGMLVILHGAEVADDIEPDFPRWAESLSLALVRLRVRGFPPSNADLPARVTATPWILRDIEDAEQWVVRGAVADVLLARRAAAEVLAGNLLPNAPWMIEGSSLGGGLAIIAAAQATLGGDAPARIAVSMPSLGDWPFRIAHVDLGYGGMIAERLRQLRSDAAAIHRSLAIADALHHAPFIKVPLLARLAHRDETVPAPAAAAVISAADRAPRTIHRVKFGHYDGGLEDLRRHCAFERRLSRFFDPALDPVAAGQEE